MARNALPLALIVFLAVSVAGAQFHVNVAAETDHRFVGPNFLNETDSYQEINGTLENIGSIGCTFWMRAEFEKGNDTVTRYSTPAEVWQGDYQDVELYYLPTNFTGKMETDLYLEYCGQEELVDEFSFNVTGNTTVEEESSVRTVEVDRDRAVVETEAESGLLIPEENPNYWKTSPARIENSTAEIRYDAPIFRKGEELVYTLVEDGQPSSKVTVKLEEQPTLTEKLWDYRFEVVSVLLVVSLLLNLAIYYRHRREQ